MVLGELNPDDIWALNCPGEAIVARSPAALVRRVPSLFRMSGEVVVGPSSVVFAPDGSYVQSVRRTVLALSALAIAAVVLAFPGLLGALLALYVLASAALVHAVTARMARSSRNGYKFNRSDVAAFDAERGILDLAVTTGRGSLARAYGPGTLRVRLKVRHPVSLVAHLAAK